MSVADRRVASRRITRRSRTRSVDTIAGTAFGTVLAVVIATASPAGADVREPIRIGQQPTSTTAAPVDSTTTAVVTSSTTVPDSTTVSVPLPSTTLAETTTTGVGTAPSTTAVVDPNAPLPPPGIVTTNRLPPHIAIPVTAPKSPAELLADGRDIFGKVIGLSPDLGAVAMSSPELAPVLAAIAPLEASISTLEKEIAEADRVVSAGADRRAQLAQERALLASDGMALTAASARYDVQLRALAARSFVLGDAANLYANTEPSGLISARRGQVIANSVLQMVAGERDTNAKSAQQKLERVQDIDEELEALDGDTEAFADRRATAEPALADAKSRLEPLRVMADELRRTAPVVGTDLTGVTLDAYWRASKQAVAEGCFVPWQLLAGIGRAETNHGTGTGGKVLASGQMTKPDIGVALDGGPGVQRILDSDGGVWDNDPVFDRAFGAMQFIPWSWARFGRDGNGDGISDPNNLYDGALTAVSYICRFGPDITTLASIRKVIFKYNAANWYVDRVVGFMTPYVQAAIPDTPGAPAPDLGSSAGPSRSRTTSSAGPTTSVGASGASGATSVPTTSDTSPTTDAPPTTDVAPTTDGSATTEQSVPPEPTSSTAVAPAVSLAATVSTR